MLAVTHRNAHRSAIANAFSRASRKREEREREREILIFFTRTVRYPADRTIKGDQYLTFAGRNHATAAGGAIALAVRVRARIQWRRSGATRLSRTEPCYSCTFYTRRHSTGQWHPVPIPRDWLRRSQVRLACARHRANLINSPNVDASRVFLVSENKPSVLRPDRF